jgi:hypothetical protein
MRPIWHLLASSVIVLGVFPVYGYWAFLAYISGFLIDADHYIYWVFKFKNFNLIENYKYCAKKDRPPVNDMIHIFHLLEFWVIVGVVGGIMWADYPFLIFPLAFGMTLHLVMDFVYGIITNPIQKRVISLIEFAKNE